MDAQTEQRPPSSVEQIPIYWQAPMAQILFAEAGHVISELSPLQKQLIERTFDPRSADTLIEPEKYPRESEYRSQSLSDISAKEFQGSNSLEEDIYAARNERNAHKDAQPESYQRSTYESTPTLSRWVLPILLQKGYRVVGSFDMRSLAAANDASGIEGGNIALRRLEISINNNIGATSAFEEGKVPTSMLVCMGGDEYVIISRDPDIHYSDNEINSFLQQERIPFTDFDKISGTTIPTSIEPLQLANERKPIVWKPLEVAEKEIPPDINHLQEDRGYLPEYTVLFNISEDHYNNLNPRTQQILRESIFDPVFLGKQLVKRPDDALKLFQAQNPGTQPIAIACSAMGLKEANKSNDGDAFLNEYYDIIEKTLLNVLRISQDAFTITRNRGSTFILLINPEKAALRSSLNKPESLVSSISEHLYSENKRRGNKLRNHISFRGIAFQETPFTASLSEIVSLVDQCSIWETIQMLTVIEEAWRARDKFVIEGNNPEHFKPEDEELFDYALSYLNDNARQMIRRVTVTRALNALTSYLVSVAGRHTDKKNDSLTEELQFYQDMIWRYGIPSMNALRDSSILSPKKMGVLYGIVGENLNDDDEEDV